MSDTDELRAALAAVTGSPDAQPGEWAISPSMHLADFDPADVAWIAACSPARIARLLDRLDAAEREIARLENLTHCGCGDQFTADEPGRCAICVAMKGDAP